MNNQLGFLQQGIKIPLPGYKSIIMERYLLNFFTGPEKSLLGVCSAISHKIKLPSVGVRVAFIVLTLFFIPLGIITYLVTYLVSVRKGKSMVRFGLLGAVLGIPLSYYFQSDVVKNFGGSSGMFSYLRTFTKMVDEYDRFFGNGIDIIYNVLMSVLIFALAGGAMGYLLDKNEKSKPS